MITIRCPAHYVRDYSNIEYPGRWIARLGWTRWSPRSPDLNLPDFLRKLKFDGKSCRTTLWNWYRSFGNKCKGICTTSKKKNSDTICVNRGYFEFGLRSTSSWIFWIQHSIFYNMLTGVNDISNITIVRTWWNRHIIIKLCEIAGFRDKYLWKLTETPSAKTL